MFVFFRGQKHGPADVFEEAGGGPHFRPMVDRYFSKKT